MEHLSMSDFPFPPRKIANVRDLVNVKSHSSYSVILWTKQELLIGEKKSPNFFLMYGFQLEVGAWRAPRLLVDV